MTTKNYALLTGAMLLSIVLTNFGLFVAPAVCYESVEEGRTFCIQDCKSRYGVEMYRYGGGGGGIGGGDSGLWRLYAKCIDDCEKKFWKEWDKNMDEIRKD
jgi:hypothetical protein